MFTSVNNLEYLKFKDNSNALNNKKRKLQTEEIHLFPNSEELDVSATASKKIKYSKDDITVVCSSNQENQIDELFNLDVITTASGKSFHILKKSTSNKENLINTNDFFKDNNTFISGYDNNKLEQYDNELINQANKSHILKSDIYESSKNNSYDSELINQTNRNFIFEEQYENLKKYQTSANSIRNLTISLPIIDRLFVLSMDHLRETLFLQKFLTNKNQEELEEFHSYILEECWGLLETAQEARKVVLFSNFNVNYNGYINPLGYIYLELNECGTGAFKTACKVILIAASNLEAFKRYSSDVQVVTLTKGGPESLNLIESTNEANIHKFLKRSQEQEKSEISHLLVAEEVYISPEGQLALNFEFCEGGNVNDKLKESLTISQKYKIALDMVTGVGQLHQLEIVHRDIKPDNFLILLDENGQILRVKLADFGKSSFRQKELRYETNHFAMSYLALEIQAKSSSDKEMYFSKEADIYQLGINIYQIFTQIPYENLLFKYNKNVSDKKAEINRIIKLKTNVNQWPDFYKMPEGIQLLIEKMIDVDPSNRLEIKDVKEELLKLLKELETA